MIELTMLEPLQVPNILPTLSINLFQQFLFTGLLLHTPLLLPLLLLLILIIHPDQIPFDKPVEHSRQPLDEIVHYVDRVGLEVLENQVYG